MNIKGIVEVQKIPYSGCQIIMEECSRATLIFYGGAYTSSDLDNPILLPTDGGKAKYDPWNHNFKK